MYTSLDSMGKVSLMMDLISQRQRALGSNIANVDTPGYIRQDINFGQYLSTMNSPLESKFGRRTFENAGKLNFIHNGNKKNDKPCYRNENSN